jgi:hypothetical protein
MALVIDNHLTGGQVSSSNTNGTITTFTCSANALVFLYFWNNNGVANVSSITDSSGQGLTWSFWAGSGGSFPVNVYWTKTTTGFLSATTITVNFTALDSSATSVYSVTGYDTTTSTSWQDGTPTFAGGSGSTGLGSLNYTTTNANTMVTYVARFGATPNPTAGGAYSLIDGANSLGAEYRVVAASGGVTYTQAWTAGNADENAIVGYAIKPTSAAPSTALMGSIWM